MPLDSVGVRRCYRHPTKVALRDCEACGKPICSECGIESGDADLCQPCAVKARGGDEMPPVPVAPTQRTAIGIGEVTIHDDGTVDAPELPPVEAEEPDSALEEGKEESADEEPERLEAPWFREEREAMAAKGSRARKAAPRERALPAARDRSSAGKAAGGKPEPEKKPAKVKQKKTHPSDQMVAALPWGIGAAVFVFGVWLVTTYVIKQWSQVAVFITGMAVPWAMYKGSTYRRWLGQQIWRRPPNNILWLCVPSFLIVALSTPLVEFLAFKIIYPGSGRYSYNTAHDFMARYFGPVGWFLVVAGVLLAFLFPWFLKVGEGWAKPEFIEKLERGEDEEGEEGDAPKGPEAMAADAKEDGD